MKKPWILFAIGILAISVFIYASREEGRLNFGKPGDDHYWIQAADSYLCFGAYDGFNWFQSSLTNESSNIMSLNNKGSLWVKKNVTPSDKELKTDISDISGALDKVLSLKGVKYRFKDEPSEEEIGLIAQDVEKVLPNIVSVDKNGLKGINYIALTPLLIEAIKIQNKRIEELEEQVNAIEELKARIAKLEK